MVLLGMYWSTAVWSRRFHIQALDQSSTAKTTETQCITGQRLLWRSGSAADWHSGLPTPFRNRSTSLRSISRPAALAVSRKILQTYWESGEARAILTCAIDS